MKIVKLMDHAYPVYVNLDHIVSVRVQDHHYVIYAVGWENSRSFSIKGNDHLGAILDSLQRVHDMKSKKLIDLLNN
ncbi:hypothetical protein [Acinetobacter phage HFM1]|nr:hypothetical protein [Acinetobacter phage HFM1]